MTRRKPMKEESLVESQKIETITGPPSTYDGLIMVKKSPQFRPWKGVPLQSVSDMDNEEVVCVNPNDIRVKEMFKNGNLQFVSDKVRTSPTGKYPRIITS